MSRKPPTGYLALLVAGIACSCDAAPQPVEVLLEGLDPVVFGAPSELSPVPWTIAPHPSFRVGGEDGREIYQFTDVTAATRGADGSVVIADGRAGVVRVYDSIGRLRMTLGFPGRGPGEFQSPTDVLVVEDSIVVWDAVLWRTSVFGPQGRFVRSESYDPANPAFYPMEGSWPSEIRLGVEGRRLVQLVAKAQSKGRSENRASEQRTAGFANHASDGGRPDLIALVPDDERVVVEAPWGPTEIIPPLARGPQVAVSRTSSRICVASSYQPEVLCVDGNSNRVGARWIHELRRVRADDPEITQWRTTAVSTYSTKMSRAVAQEALSLVPLPETRPAFSGLILDSLDHLWLDLGPSSDGASAREYLVLDVDLRPVGTMTLPPLRVLEIGVEHVLGVRSDALGVQEVVAFSLTR